jgi:amino acid permease
VSIPSFLLRVSADQLRGILLSYIRFYHGLKVQGISREGFPYKAPFQPYFSYYGVSTAHHHLHA